MCMQFKKEDECVCNSKKSDTLRVMLACSL